MLSKKYYLKKKEDLSDFQFEARWLLSFSDLLLLLIAIFVLKISMSTFIKPGETNKTEEIAVEEPKAKFSGKYGEILWYASVSEKDLQKEELDFNLKEKVATIAKTFNTADYQIILAYNQYNEGNISDSLKSGYYSKLISQLIDNGVDLENIFLTTDSSFPTLQEQNSADSSKKNNLIDIVISRNQNTF